MLISCTAKEAETEKSDAWRSFALEKDLASNRQKIFALDFFNGGVPAGVIFEGVLDDLRSLNASGPNEAKYIDRLAEISFVGALSYFESFCKDHFASAINIYPKLIERLDKANLNTLVEAQKVVELSGQRHQQIGFLLAEKFDFGVQKSIIFIIAF
jgi:hypothetical protein